MSAPRPTLFNSFYVVQGIRGTNGAVQPEVVWQYPPDPTAGPLKDVARFCHPDCEAMKPARHKVSEEFTFVLTGDGGRRIFGYCRRVLPPGPAGRADTGRRLPETLCFVSNYPYSTLFNEVLAFTQIRRWHDQHSLEAMLADMHQLHPFPMPGEVFSIRPLNQEYRVVRPSEGEVSNRKLACRELIKRLPQSKLILFISAILLEKRLIVVARELDVLSTCIHAAMALAYPFEWQHIFIPVLPHSLLHYACAPMPFLVGVQADLIAEVQDLPLSEVVFVNLDNGSVWTTDPDPLCPMSSSGASSSADSAADGIGMGGGGGMAGSGFIASSNGKPSKIVRLGAKLASKVLLNFNF